MISNKQLREAIQAKGFRFLCETVRSQTYKKKGGLDRLTVSKNAFHQEKVVKSVLRGAGYTDTEIQLFLIKNQNRGEFREDSGESTDT